MYARTHYARAPYARAEGPTNITVVGSPAYGEGHSPNGTTPLPVVVVGSVAYGDGFAPSADLQVTVGGAVAFGHGFSPSGTPVFSGAALVVVGSPAFGHGFAPSGVPVLDLRLGAWTLDLSQAWGFALDAEIDVSIETTVETVTDGAKIHRVSETYPTPTLSNGRPT